MNVTSSLKRTLRYAVLALVVVLGLISIIATNAPTFTVVVDSRDSQSNFLVSRALEGGEEKNQEETEPSVAVAPINQDIVVAAMIGLGRKDTSGNRINKGLRYSYSANSGVNWLSQLIPASNWQRTNFSDPAVTIDEQASNSNAYLVGYFHDYDEQGSIINILPMLARVNMNALKSPEVITFTDGSNRLFDKPYIAVSGSGLGSKIIVVYTAVNPTSKTDREIRAITINPTTAFQSPGQKKFLSTTIAQGNNWGAYPSVGPDGKIYVAWTGFSPVAGDPGKFFGKIAFAQFDPQTNRWSQARTLAELGSNPAINGVYRSTAYPVMGVASNPDNIVANWVYATFADQPPLYTPISKLGASSINALDINDRGDIVGWYHKATSPPDTTTGYRVSSRGNFVEFSYPNAEKTIAQGVNDKGTVVGTIVEGGASGGFIWNGSEFTRFSYPEPLTDTNATDINEAGDIVGWYKKQKTETKQRSYGFLRRANGTFEPLNYPNALRTFPRGINKGGQIVGWYADSNEDEDEHGFIYDDGQWSQVDFPGGKGTYLSKINSDDNYSFVGWYLDDTNLSHGLIGKRNSTPIKIDYPNQSKVVLYGINGSSQIVGAYDGINPFVMTGLGEEASLSDIWSIISNNGGETWSLPARVNDDPKGDQFFPWLCVTPAGTAYVSWLDRRDDDPNNLLYHVYASAYYLGARLNNVKVTTAPSNPLNALLKNKDTGGFIGDYTGLACGKDKAYPVWPDLRNQGQDVQDIYSAIIRVVSK